MLLSETKVNDKTIVKRIVSNRDIARRFLDIGLTPGTVVETLFENISKNLCAYRIRGAVVSIRKSDSKDIIVAYDE